MLPSIIEDPIKEKAQSDDGKSGKKTKKESWESSSGGVVEDIMYSEDAKSKEGKKTKKQRKLEA